MRCCLFDEKKVYLIVLFFSFIDKSDLMKEIDLIYFSRNSFLFFFEIIIIWVLKEILSLFLIKELINNLKEEF